MSHDIKRITFIFFICFCLDFCTSEETVPYDSLKIRVFNFTESYNKHIPPQGINDAPEIVKLSMLIHRVAHVDENNQEVRLDVTLRLAWNEPRVNLNNAFVQSFKRPVSLDPDDVSKFWIPDIYVRQMQDFKLVSMFNPLHSLKIFTNQTVLYKVTTSITIGCPMDFSMYPLDVQRCKMDFSSYTYPNSTIRLVWGRPPITFPLGTKRPLRLPRYEVRFNIVMKKHPIILSTMEGYYSIARLEFVLRRKFQSHLLDTYLPSMIFVMISWISFLVKPEVVPGRMVLLVTTLLTLITMTNSVRSSSPASLELQCDEVWLIVCTLFVALALLEYAVLLFGLRYGPALCMQSVEPHSPLRNTDGIINNNSGGRCGPSVENLSTNINENGISTVKNRSENGVSKIEVKSSEDAVTANRPRASLALVLKRKPRFLHSPEQSSLDKMALALFPVGFMIFNITYWMLSTSARAQEEDDLL